jgi:REP element-mobilizing transposase RayT
MPRLRKYFNNKTVTMVTTRTEEGLPLVASLVLNFIIWGILAKAKKLYDVKICHFLFMANHFHMLLAVSNPDHLPAFVGYIKAETSHAINLLLGRQKKTIWCEGYDSPIILDVRTVLRYLRYIYLNPVEAGLVNSIDEYPGVSSWQMFKTGKLKKPCKHLLRPMIKQLPYAALTINEQKAIVARYEEKSKSSNEFVLEPDAWMECFSGFTLKKLERLNQWNVTLIRQKEQKLKKIRTLQNKEVIGSTALRRQSMLKEYTPRKFSKRMICLGSDIEYRIRFISTFKAICDRAQEVYEGWKRGELHLKIPPGLFAPSMPTLICNLSIT